jgi:hypothetical protein
LGRRGLLWEHAPASPDAKAAAVRGAAGSALHYSGLHHFEHIFLSKLEYKCMK